MPKRATPLTARAVERSKKPGLFADGNGLYLHVGEGGAAKSWIFRYLIDGQRRDMGLGPVSIITLSAARERALELRRRVYDGIDPLEERRQEKAKRRQARQQRVLTFAEAAAGYIDAHIDSWSDRRGWPDSMRLYVNPVIGELPVAEIDLPAVLRVLEPIWKTKTESAKRVRGRIEVILDWAAVRGHRPRGDNPARWRGHLDKLLATPSKIARTEHHKAMHYRDVPEFMPQLRGYGGMPAAAIEFLILTCARAGEVLGARWPEADLSRRIWTVPASRMKADREHRVPLSEPSLELLDRMAPFKRNSDDHVFLGQFSGRPMVSAALLQCLRTIRPGVTTHGFRSTFRDWVADQTDFPPELAELALAHQVGTRVERAYLRSDGFERRRALADAWAAHCVSGC